MFLKVRFASNGARARPGVFASPATCPPLCTAAPSKPLSIVVNAKQCARILRSETGHNTIFSVEIAGGARETAMFKDWQVDPLKGALLHVDLLRIAMDVKMRVRVPVHTFGEPVGVKMQGGVFEMVTREVEVECLPGDIPEEFKVDVSGMNIGKQLRASDLPFDPEKVKLVSDPLRVIAHVVTLKKEEEPTAEAVATTAATPAEPEVIKKGKKDEEGGRSGRKAQGQERVTVRRCGLRYANHRGPRQPGQAIRRNAAQPGLFGDRCPGRKSRDSRHPPGIEVFRWVGEDRGARRSPGQAADDDESQRRGRSDVFSIATNAHRPI